jgi:hypothetical protein
MHLVISKIVRKTGHPHLQKIQTVPNIFDSSLTGMNQAGAISGLSFSTKTILECQGVRISGKDFRKAS